MIPTVTYDYSNLRGRITKVFGSEKKFAEAIGMTSTTLSLIFNNKSQFKQSTIRLACELLDIPPEEISEYFFAEEVKEA